MKVLLIDSKGDWLSNIKNGFESSPEVITAECHNRREAMQAIAIYKPEIIFLAHSLTTGGNEGLSIANHVTGITVFAITNQTDAALLYRQRGIEAIRRADVCQKIEEIIEGKNAI